MFAVSGLCVILHFCQIPIEKYSSIEAINVKSHLSPINSFGALLCKVWPERARQIMFMLWWCLWYRDHSLMIITADQSDEQTSRGSTASEKYLLIICTKVGHTNWPWVTRNNRQRSAQFSLSFGVKVGYFLWVDMKPAVVLLGLILLLDVAFAAEGKSYIQALWMQV